VVSQDLLELPEQAVLLVHPVQVASLDLLEQVVQAELQDLLVHQEQVVSQDLPEQVVQVALQDQAVLLDQAV
jgi:hypothetical protein